MSSRWSGQEYRVDYLPAESDTGMFGGNSNWRGPIWMPVNALIIRALLHYYLVLRRQLQDRVPDRLGQLDEPVRGCPGNRQSADPHLPARRSRPAAGISEATEKFQHDPHWRDNLLFYEYFHGDNGAGIGASHQTGWTGCRREPDRDLREARRRDLSARRKRSGLWPRSGERIATARQSCHCEVFAHGRRPTRPA